MSSDWFPTMSPFELRQIDIEGDAERERAGARKLRQMADRILVLEAALHPVAMTTPAPYDCPTCHGRGLVQNMPSLDCPDDEIACPQCGGDGWVEDTGVEYETEAPRMDEEAWS